MTTILGAIAVVVLFVVLLDALKLVERARDAIAISRSSVEALKSPALDDDAKERALQKGAVAMFRLLLLMLLGFGVALLAPMALIWLLDWLGVLSFDSVMAMLVRWDFMLAATVLGIGLFVALVKIRR